ncbi:MAG: tungsten ABC transporter substrate-binding protein [Chitinivibrionales bacterium]|nr:tungsten ABC transporter substrate-binding protein [Chitinivibrionales bacterium]
MNLFLSVLLFFIAGVKCAEAKNAAIIKMATTTSTENSGLLDVLLPEFKKQTGIKVRTIAVGTGKALQHGRNGDVDVVFVHARRAEDAFVNKGFGIYRHDVMFNDFVIVGPRSDPAGIDGMKDAVAALKKIRSTGSGFVSRGDESGTHKKEQSIWRKAGVAPDWKLFLAAGQGMGAVLMIAHEKQAYTLTDRGTFIAFEEKIGPEILCEGDTLLHNPYGVIAVNPEKHVHVNIAQARTFIDWLLSEAGQQIIGNFRLRGKQLFYPAAASPTRQ